MTKAKEALDMIKNTTFFVNGVTDALAMHVNCSYEKAVKKLETIRKALELLDTVQKGGVSIIEYCQGKPHEVAQSITDKYILIERKDYDRE